MNNPQIAITGLGLLAGSGLGHEAFWSALVSGQTCIRPPTRVKPDAFPGTCVSEVPANAGAKDFVPKHYRKAVKVMARDTELAVIAAALAVKDARLSTRANIAEDDTTTKPTYAADRMGCQIGAGLIPAEVPEIAGAFVHSRNAGASPEELDRTNGFSLRAWGTIQPAADPATSNGGTTTGATGGGMGHLQPLWLLKYLPNMLACHVTILHGTEGPSNTITCSEASSLLCIGESCRVIERGDADICFSGGAESKINLVGLSRMHALGRLAAWPQTATPDFKPEIHPFAPDSKGSTPGEGGGILLLERSDLAASRGATRYAHILGFGAAQAALENLPVLAGHSTIIMARASKHTQNPKSGLALAILSALRDANLTPNDIDAIIPHAIGVPSMDTAELASFREVFGPRLDTIPLIALTPIIGDCAAGAGGLQVAAAALALHHQTLPTHYVANTRYPSAPKTLRTILTCSGSLAGQTAAVVVGK